MKYSLIFAVLVGAVAAVPIAGLEETRNIAVHEKQARGDEAIDVSGYNWKEKKARAEDVDLAANAWKERKARGDEAIDVSGYNWKEKKARAEDVDLAANAWKERKARGDEAIDVSGYNW
ncbi:hypothetical protein ONS96_012582 [Cadophora gregata f. sp. sojae]|nr:hypothetical protein ONS96_012582 [Cadophora gregata f. sp. sojae]